MRLGRRGLAAAAALVLVGGGVAVYLARGGRGEAAPELLWRVDRRDLVITVEEGGNLKAARSVELSCQVEGQSTILYLIPEGGRVKEGELLVRLDASDLEERRAQQLITVEAALASMRQAEEAYEIQKNQNESNINAARLAVEFAEIDLVKYLTGDWPQERRKALSQIKINRSERSQAEGRLEWTRKLYEKGYVAATDLESDTLNRDRVLLDVENAESALYLMERYTFPKEIKKLLSDYVEAKQELFRVIRKARAQLAQAEADLKAKRTTYDLQKERLEKLDEQIRNAEIRAPQDGMVVYAKPEGRFWRESRIIEEGATVHERQPIITLPDVSEMIVSIQVHESQIDMVRVGQKAEIVAEPFPDRVFTGEVIKVGLLPDHVNRWRNPDLMVYNTDVRLDHTDPALRPGMSARVKIMVEKVPDVVCVPLQSVVAEGKEKYVYVWEDGQIKRRLVETGRYNDSFAEIVSGLSEGETVLLAPPAVEQEKEGQGAEEEIAEEGGEALAPPGEIGEGPRPEGLVKRPEGGVKRPEGGGPRRPRGPGSGRKKGPAPAGTRAPRGR